MIAQIAKWGNSLALRIPSAYAKEAKVEEGYSVEMNVIDGKIIITPIESAPSYDLAQLLALINEENLHAEADTGAPVGKEIW